MTLDAYCLHLGTAQCRLSPSLPPCGAIRTRGGHVERRRTEEARDAGAEGALRPDLVDPADQTRRRFRHQRPGADQDLQAAGRPMPAARLLGAEGGRSKGLEKEPARSTQRDQPDCHHHADASRSTASRDFRRGESACRSRPGESRRHRRFREAEQTPRHRGGMARRTPGSEERGAREAPDVRLCIRSGRFHRGRSATPSHFRRPVQSDRARRRGGQAAASASTRRRDQGREDRVPDPSEAEAGSAPSDRRGKAAALQSRSRVHHGNQGDRHPRLQDQDVPARPLASGMDRKRGKATGSPVARHCGDLTRRRAAAGSAEARARGGRAASANRRAAAL